MKLFVSVIVAAIVIIGGFVGAGLMDSSFSITGAVVGGVGAAVLLGLGAYLGAQEREKALRKMEKQEQNREQNRREIEQTAQEAEIRQYKEEIRRYKREIRKYKKGLEKIEEEKGLEEIELEEKGDYRSLLTSYGYSVQLCQQCGMSVIG